MPALLKITWGHARLCGSKRDLVAQFVQRLSELCARSLFACGNDSAPCSM